MKRLAPEDHATAPKRRRKPPATSAMSDSQDSDPDKSDSEELNFPPTLLNEIAQDFGRSKLTRKSHRNWRISSIQRGQTTISMLAPGKISSCHNRSSVGYLKCLEFYNNRWRSKLEEARLKEKLAKYNRPDNCEKLTVSKVNPEIWNKLKHVTRSADLRLANMRKILVKVGSAVAKSTDILLALRADPEKTSPSAFIQKLG